MQRRLEQLRCHEKNNLSVLNGVVDLVAIAGLGSVGVGAAMADAASRAKDKTSRGSMKEFLKC